VEPGGRCADANKSRVGERRADHDGQSSGAMTTGLAASSVTAATNAPALRSSATVLWPVAWKFGDNQGRMCGMSALANQTDLARRGIRKIQKSLIFWPRDSEEMN
jgi:hypothetical protein